MQKKLSCNFFVELHLIKVGVKDFELQFLGRAPSDWGGCKMQDFELQVLGRAPFDNVGVSEKIWVASSR